MRTEPSRQEVSEAESSRGSRSAGGLAGTHAACEAGGVEWERESKAALDSEGRKINKQAKKSFQKGKACLTAWPLGIFTILPSIPNNKGKFGGN